MSATRTLHPNNEEVRAWGDKHYWDVPRRGRLPQWLIEAWDKTHPKRKYVHSEAHHGTKGGYTQHGCREACCAGPRAAYVASLRAANRAA